MAPTHDAHSHARAAGGCGGADAHAGQGGGGAVGGERLRLLFRDDLRGRVLGSGRSLGGARVLRRSAVLVSNKTLRESWNSFSAVLTARHLSINSFGRMPRPSPLRHLNHNKLRSQPN